MYNPPVLGDVNGLLGAINMGNAVGGTNWPGVAYDPETHNIIAQANNAGITSTSLVEPPPNFSDIKYVSGVAGRAFTEVIGPGDCCAADSPRAVAQAQAAGPAGGGDAGGGRESGGKAGGPGREGGAAEGIADALPRRRQAVHGRRDQRRRVLGRVSGVHVPEKRRERSEGTAETAEL